MDSKTVSLVAFLCLVVSLTLVTAQKLCEDIDTSACKLIALQQPDFCSNPTLAKEACPRYCKLCPLECYNCNATVLDYHDCNTTELCGQGEVCMRKELKSFVDNHHEYQMTCEDKALCDGTGVAFPFGKRTIESRDVSLTCCSEDLCNYPDNMPTTQSDCSKKDIVFMVDTSLRMLHTDFSHVINFIFHVVNGLDIGRNDNLVSVNTYNTMVSPAFDLDQHTDKYELLRAIQTLKPSSTGGLGGFGGFLGVREDTDEAVQFLVQRALTSSGGDRSGFPDAVVIVADADTARQVQVTLQHQQQLQKLSNDVIVVSVGTSTGSSGESVATDANHILHVQSYGDLPTSAVDGVVKLLNVC